MARMDPSTVQERHFAMFPESTVVVTMLDEASRFQLQSASLHEEEQYNGVSPRGERNTSCLGARARNQACVS